MKTQIDWTKFKGTITKLDPGPKRANLRMDKVSASPYKPKGEIARLNELSRRSRVETVQVTVRLKRD